MTDNELVKKLKILGEIQPENSWKQEARDILLTQISNSVVTNNKINFWDKIIFTSRGVFSFLPRTAWAVICLVIIFTGGGFSAYAAKVSRPGDAFYAVKVWKERIQLAMTLNSEDKAKLDMKLASIHAKEITEVLADPKFNYPGNEKKAEQLAQNFQTEINTVKRRYSEINKLQDDKPAVADVSASSKPASGSGSGENSVVGIGDFQKNTDGKVYGVDSGKDAQGVQVYDPSAVKSGLEGKISTSSLAAKAVTGSSTIPAATIASGTPAEVNDDVSSNLDKAAQSFAAKDFSGAKDILEKVGVIIDKIDQNGVPNVPVAGTSTTDGKTSVGIGSSSETK
ncbi:MAG TPA: DUF5667 domain-containing protein [Candidatus Methylomirabilis sp.]|nr:DUF5667 domain-containing protein [Candidatus Methylomirabilis sp.]